MFLSPVFYVKRALRLMVLFLLHIMHMLYCFLLLALIFVLLAALVSHCTPPLCTWIKFIQALYHSFFFLLVAEWTWGIVRPVPISNQEAIMG